MLKKLINQLKKQLAPEEMEEGEQVPQRPKAAQPKAAQPKGVSRRKGFAKREEPEEMESSESTTTTTTSEEEAQEQMTDQTLQGKVVIVTGATGSLGFEMCRLLAKKGATIIMACRNTEKGKEAAASIIDETGNEDIQVMKLDLSSLTSVEKFASKFLNMKLPLHILINNAAVINCPNEMTEDGFDCQFQINYIAPFALTNLLVERMIKSAPARIINVSALFHLLGKFNPENMKGGKKKSLTIPSFCNSKYALVEFSYELARRLEGTGVTVNVVDPLLSATGGIRQSSHPGAFKTLAGGLQQMGLSPEKAAEQFVWVATAPELENTTGQYFVNCHPMKRMVRGYNPIKAKNMWRQTAEMLQMETVV